MILITQLKEICQEIIQQIPQLHNQYLLVFDAENTENKLSDKDGVRLVATIPSANAKGQLSGRRNESAVIFFILELPPSDVHSDDTFEKLQPYILQLQQYLEDKASNGCSYLTWFNTAETTIDPIFNEFGGFYGWQLMCVF